MANNTTEVIFLVPADPDGQHGAIFGYFTAVLAVCEVVIFFAAWKRVGVTKRHASRFADAAVSIISYAATWATWCLLAITMTSGDGPCPPSLTQDEQENLKVGVSDGQARGIVAILFFFDVLGIQLLSVISAIRGVVKYAEDDPVPEYMVLINTGETAVVTVNTAAPDESEQLASSASVLPKPPRPPQSLDEIDEKWAKWARGVALGTCLGAVVGMVGLGLAAVYPSPGPYVNVLSVDEDCVAGFDRIDSDAAHHFLFSSTIFIVGVGAILGIVIAFAIFLPGVFAVVAGVLGFLGVIAAAILTCILVVALILAGWRVFLRRVSDFDPHELNIRFERFSYNLDALPLDCGHLFVVRVITLAFAFISVVIRHYLLPPHPSKQITWPLIKDTVKTRWAELISTVSGRRVSPA
jgi:hypothetical protein